MNENIQNEIYKVSIATTLSLITYGCFGPFLMYQGILKQEQIKKLSQLTEQLFMPCLIFSSFVMTIDLYDVKQWLTLSILSVYTCFQGGLLGYLLCKYVLKDLRHVKLIVIVCALSMTSSIELIISYNLRYHLSEISSDYQQQLDTSHIGKSAFSRAQSYIMIYYTVNILFRWSVARNQVLNLKLEQNEEQEALINGTSYVVGDKRYSFINPPFLSAILAIIAISIPIIRDQLRTQGQVLNRMILSTSQIVGTISPPMIQIIYGATIYATYKNNFNQIKLNRKQICGIAFVKLILNPMIGWIVLQTIISFGLLNDPVSHFIVILQFSSPTAISLVLITSLYSDFGQEVGVILLIQQIILFFTMPIIIIMFLSYYYNL